MTTEPRFSLIVRNKLAATEGRERGWVVGENSSLEVVDTPGATVTEKREKDRNPYVVCKRS